MADKNAPALRDKIEWEGWPDALEWFSGETFENQRVHDIVQEGLDHHIALEKLYAELIPLLESDEDDS